jgi:PAS domain S-box-containing protein
MSTLPLKTETAAPRLRFAFANPLRLCGSFATHAKPQAAVVSYTCGVDADLAASVATAVAAVAEIMPPQRAGDSLRQSEALFRLVWESSVDGMRLTDAEGTTILVNESFCELVGKRREELEGHSFALIHAPARRDRVLSTYRDRFAARTFLNHYETEATFWNGNTFWLDLSNSFLEVPGQAPLLLTVFRDITRRKQADRVIAEQAELLEKARDAIIVCDLDDRILFWNRGAERLYGWKAAEALGQVAGEFLFRGRCAEDHKAHEIEAQTGEWTGELRQTTRAGNEIIVQSRRTLLRDEKSLPKATLLINTDVTEKKKLEAQYLRAQRMESLGTLAGGIAHDLNNVLTPITMAVELLRRPIPEQDRMAMLGILEASAHRGADMVKQILSFARGVEGRRVPLQIKRVLRETEKILRHSLAKSIDIDLKLPEELWLVSADATQLAQVFMNLCVNARDAMPDGGRLALRAENIVLDQHYARLHLQARPGRFVLVRVEDTGTGIPPEHLDKIFDPFFTTKEVGKGTGLGLATVLGIVKSHGGFINVYSELGQGSHFTVYLPTAEADQHEHKPEFPALHLGHGELVLIVDDEAAIREITRSTLEAHGYRVLVAPDGREALAVYAQRSGEIDVVLTDMMMPVMDGPATIRALHELNPQVRIIAASGLSVDSETADPARFGVRSVLMKPYTAEKLLRSVQESLR